MTGTGGRGVPLELVAPLIVCYYRFAMEKIVRITRVEEQDETRRADMREMTPAARMEALSIDKILSGYKIELKSLG